MKFLRILLLLALFPQPAHAYVDPGSGILVWQALISAIGGVLLFLRNPIRSFRQAVAKVRAFITKSTRG